MDKFIRDVRQGIDSRDIDQVIQGVQNLVALPKIFPVTDWKAYFDAAVHKDSLNDRYLMLEKLLVAMARLQDSHQHSEDLRELGEDLQGFVIDLLYKDLPHPPSGYLSTLPLSTRPIQTENTGKEEPEGAQPTAANSIKYSFRSSDGSNYNPLFPSLGKAGTPYARSVSSTKFLPLGSLPDAGLVFDTLLKRDKYVEHPGGVSSMFFAFANLIIHSIFHTNPRDPTLNSTSSYLDLSILYGNSDKEQARMRRFDGTGKLWDDVFSDSRLLLMPPATCALLILFCRNHNYVAEKILTINERRQYKDPKELNTDQRKAQDQEIFQRARLVNTGFFVQIILGDYVGAILGQVRDGMDWRLNPLLEMRQANHEWAPRGEGNVISVEFNLLYRWHATLSEQDAKWTEAEFKKHFGENLAEVSPMAFIQAAGKALTQPDDVREWTFQGLKRVDGRFRDEDLAKILMDATEYRSSAFKARGIPEALRVVEILGIEQARRWGTCSLNEFRKFMGLKPYKSFEDWNSRDKGVAAAARSLYKNIDNLELYVGLQAEEAKKPGPGAGLCPGYTISRAILADAVCLTRGDRYLTVDFTPFNLTSWGYEDCQYNKADGSYGGMLPKLLFRTLPDQYEPNSSHARFPFLVPSYMEDEVRQRDKKEGTNNYAKYTWTRPPVPPPVVTIKAFGDVQQFLESKEFKEGSGDRLEAAMGRTPPDLSFIQDRLVEGKDEWAKFFVSLTDHLLQHRAIDHVGSKNKLRSVDIVKDVLNVLPVRWICQRIAGLHIEEPDHEHNTEEEYTKKFQDVCQYIFDDLDYYHDWELRESTATTYEQVSEEIMNDFNSFGSVILNAYKSFVDYDPNDTSRQFLQKLYQARGRLTAKELADAIFAEIIPTAAHFSQALAHTVNYYLDEDKKAQREEIVRLSKQRTQEAKKQVVKHIYKALACDPPISGSFLTAKNATKTAGHTLNTGDRVFVALGTKESEIHSEYFSIGVGAHGLLLQPLFETIAPPVLGAILGLPNLKRAPGESGKFNRFTEDYHGVPLQQYITHEGRVSTFPDSLIIQYTQA